jgi:hypothetical protein
MRDVAFRLILERCCLSVSKTHQGNLLLTSDEPLSEQVLGNVILIRNRVIVAKSECPFKSPSLNNLIVMHVPSTGVVSFPPSFWQFDCVVLTPNRFLPITLLPSQIYHPLIPERAVRSVVFKPSIHRSNVPITGLENSQTILPTQCSVLHYRR